MKECRAEHLLGSVLKMLEDEDLDNDVPGDESKPLSRKKLLIFILPVVIVIGLSAGLFYVFNNSYDSNAGSYSVIRKASSDSKSPDDVTVFYDLPEITTLLKAEPGSVKERLLIRLNLELSSIEDTKTIEILTPKIIDAVIAHTIELTPREISDSSGLYWLREELLYRINLITNPIKVSSLNFRTFEVEPAGGNNK